MLKGNFFINYINNNFKIIDVLKKYNYPIQKTYSGFRTKALWRGNKKFSVKFNNKSYIDFGNDDDKGDVFKIFCEINDIDYFSNKSIELFFMDFNIDRKTLKFSPVIVNNFNDEEDNENLKKTNELEVIKKIWDNSEEVKYSSYFNQKKISLEKYKNYYFYKLIKQIRFKREISNLFKKNKLTKVKKYEYHYQKSVIIPVFDIDDQSLISIQYFLDSEVLKHFKKNGIFEFDVNKEYHKNTTTKKGYFCLSKVNFLDCIKNSEIFILGEGFATCFSIYDSINNSYNKEIPVICCFSAHNLQIVSDYLSKKYNDKIFIVAMDRDSPIIINNKIKSLNGVGYKILKNPKYNLYFSTPVFNIKHDKAIIIYDENQNYYKNSDYNKNLFSDFNDLYKISKQKVVKSFWFSLAEYCFVNEKYKILEKLDLNHKILLNYFIKRIEKILKNNKNFSFFKTFFLDNQKINSFIDNNKYLEYNNYLFKLNSLIEAGLTIRKENNDF